MKRERPRQWFNSIIIYKFYLQIDRLSSLRNEKFFERLGKKIKQQQVTMKFVTTGNITWTDESQDSETAKTIKLKRLIFRRLIWEHQSVLNNSFTMESLILAQDER